MDELTRMGYRAHAGSDGYRRRRDKAVEIIRGARDHVVSVSWGKDSSALLALTAEVLGHVQVAHVRFPNPAERPEDMDAVRDATLAILRRKAKIDYVERACPGEWEMFEAAAGAFVAPETLAQHEALKQHLDAELALRRDLTPDRVMLGLRAGESMARLCNFAARGHAYRRLDGLQVAQPLAGWSAADVWATLVVHELPWLRVYDVAPDRDRQRSEILWADPRADAGRRRGDMQVWLEAYPQTVRQWFERWPELKAVAHV